MAAIAHNITEKQLEELFLASLAVERERALPEETARRNANDITYAVFRGLITFESAVQRVVNNARVVFSH